MFKTLGHGGDKLEHFLFACFMLYGHGCLPQLSNKKARHNSYSLGDDAEKLTYWSFYLAYCSMNFETWDAVSIA